MSKTIGEQLGCDNAVFMSQIADAYESEDHVVGPETTLAVRSLRATLLRLKYSAEPRDQDALRSIDANFMDLDDVSYSDDEPHSFDPGRNLTGRLTRANRQQFADFAVWYSGRIVQIGMQLERDQPELQADALQRTDNLIRCGIFPKSASALMQRSAEWAGSFTPIGSVEQVANSNVGYCYEGGVGIANMYGLPYFPDVITLQMKQTTFHEYLHGVGQIDNCRRGIFNGLTKHASSTYFRWLEEAFVSEAAGAAVASTPRAHQTVEQSYPVERQFLEVVMHNASVTIDLSDLSAAHFSRRQVNAKARRHVESGMAASLNDLFPEFEGQALTGINEIYEKQHLRRDRACYLSSLLQRLG